MPVMASKRKTRKKSDRKLNVSPSTSFQRLHTERGGLTEDEVKGITQHIESMVSKKMKDEIRMTESTILRALSPLSKNSLHGNFTSLHAEISPKDGNTGLVQSEYHGTESDQKNLSPEGSFVGEQANLYCMTSG